jgi:hypothetical protein
MDQALIDQFLRCEKNELIQVAHRLLRSGERRTPTADAIWNLYI